VNRRQEEREEGRGGHTAERDIPGYDGDRGGCEPHEHKSPRFVPCDNLVIYPTNSGAQYPESPDFGVIFGGIKDVVLVPRL